MDDERIGKLIEAANAATGELRGIKRWIRFFGILTIMGLVVGVIVSVQVFTMIAEGLDAMGGF